MKNLNLIVLIVTLFLSTFSSANLITNGSFEDINVNNNSWRWYKSELDTGWDGSNIEIWENFLGVQATDGLQFAELNAHASKGPAYSIYQTFDTTIGLTYDFSFSYRARRSNNEAFNVEISSQLMNGFPILIDDHTKDKWSFFTGSFVANDITSKIMFTSVFPKKGTVGNFLDNISVRAALNPLITTSAIPEPSMLFLTAIALFFFTRLFRSKA